MYHDGYYKVVGSALEKAPRIVRIDGVVYVNADKDPALMNRLGYSWWTAAAVAEWYKEHPVPVSARQRCTRYQLVTCLRTHYQALYTALMSLLTNPATDEQKGFVAYWNMVNDLDRNNADFKALQAALGITDEQVDEIFSKIEGDEPNEVEE